MIRLATPSDSAALLEIYRPYVEKTAITFETAVPSEAEFRNRIIEISAQFPYLVWEEKGRILGYAYAHPFHERAAYRWTVESSVYVSENARHRGIGSVLYQALFVLLKAQNVETVCAVVTLPNDPSIAFHQRMDFTLAGKLPDVGFKLGNWYGAAYLYRRLLPKTDCPSPLLPLSALGPEILRQAGI